MQYLSSGPQLPVCLVAKISTVSHKLVHMYNSTQLNEPPTKVSGLQGEKDASYGIHPMIIICTYMYVVE